MTSVALVDVSHECAKSTVALRYMPFTIVIA